MYENIIKSLTLEEKVGQLLCVDIDGGDDPEKVEEYVKRVKPGGIFVVGMTAEQVKMYTDMVNKYTKLPVIVSSDIENGPETAVKGTGYLPAPMAWGACNDVELIKEAGRECAKICRRNGIHWTYSPVVDINYNFRSPECNIRAISDSPTLVKKIAAAAIDGMQEDSLMACTAKHFPGQGIDERNSHFCPGVNDLSKEEWLATYGEVYKEMFRHGVKSVMLGHISLPAFEDEFDECIGAPPACVSYSLITRLLKGELGFDGCVVSDALSMVGISASVEDSSRLCVKFLVSGGDMLLFPEKNDYYTLLEALKTGELTEERIDDALSRVLGLKESVRLIGGEKIDESKLVYGRDFNAIAQDIADKSITLIRDQRSILPVNELKKGDKILFVNMHQPYSPITGNEYLAMKRAFEERGCAVDILDNPDHYKVKEIMDSYAMVLLNLKYSPRDYHGGTLRIGWSTIMPMWRAYILRHPRLIAISFGDPYKLFDMPYLKEYINAYYPTDEVQLAVAKAILGEIPFMGRSPIEFKGFFKREAE